MNQNFPVLGYDIGGTKIAVALGMSDGTILGADRISSRGKTPEEALPALVEMGKKLIKEAGIEENGPRAIGISAPAPMDIPNGILTAPTNNKTWKNVPIRDYFSEKFKAPAFLENDANAGVLAEWMFGAGKGTKDIIYLTMSTGIGGGIIANGHLLHGKGFLAGELGHTVLDPEGPLCGCGMKGCYEAFCAGLPVAERVQKELAGQPDHPLVKLAGGKVENIDFIVIENAVREGIPYAVSLWDEMCLRHAQAIGMFINIFNPEKIILGTIAWACGDMFMEPLKKHLPDFCWKETYAGCDVTLSALRRDIGSYAGICAALNCLYEKGEFDLSLN